MADNINEHMSSLCLSNPNQHGFTSRKSCVTQLTNAIHNWAGILDAPHPPRIDVIFLDFSKAFDVIPHHILLDKLARLYNIRGQTWTWLKSFLLNRKQRVLYKGSFSDWAPVTSGVPQGSVLGPLLFNIFINDISNNLASNSLLFADDAVIYINSPSDEHVLQSDLTQLERWSQTNAMKLNTCKTKVLHDPLQETGPTSSVLSQWLSTQHHYRIQIPGNHHK